MPQGRYGTNIRCPRCLGGIPNDLHVGAYPGALSRYDNATEICSDCGVLEAMWQFTQREPLPPPDVAIKAIVEPDDD